MHRGIGGLARTHRVFDERAWRGRHWRSCSSKHHLDKAGGGKAQSQSQLNRRERKRTYFERGLRARVVPARGSSHSFARVVLRKGARQDTHSTALRQRRLCAASARRRHSEQYTKGGSCTICSDEARADSTPQIPTHCSLSIDLVEADQNQMQSELCSKHFCQLEAMA
eukprot:2606170-Pleurochrysis_carterae.AAC.1